MKVAIDSGEQGSGERNSFSKPCCPRQPSCFFKLPSSGYLSRQESVDENYRAGIYPNWIIGKQC